MLNLRIDPELEALIPPLAPEERKQLRENILADGRIFDPIKCWEAPEGLTIVDGHNRYDAYLLYPHLPEPSIEILPLRSEDAVRDWMRRYQRGRRNLSRDQKIIEDIRNGVESPGNRTTKSMAKVLIEQCPEEADNVYAGRKTVQQAYNDWRNSTHPSTAPTFAKPRLKAPKGRIHVVIGDTQVKPGVRTDHLTWIGRYIADQFTGQDVSVIHLGDHWDMPSLSSYDQGKKAIEGRRYIDDIKAGNEAFARLCAPIEAAMKLHRRWKPELHFLLGNHEDRINRACNDNAQLDGALSLDDIDTRGWMRHGFLEPLTLDGVSYAHYFIAQNTGKPLAGDNAELRLKTVGTSFTMGHQQGRKWAERQIATGRRQCALILGSTYLHDEEYRGPQANGNWRGIAVCHQVENGQYDPMFVSLDYLCRRYEGQTLAEFLEGTLLVGSQR
jgi:hypothetical protein